MEAPDDAVRSLRPLRQLPGVAPGVATDGACLPPPAAGLAAASATTPRPTAADPLALAWRLWWRALVTRRWLIFGVTALCTLAALAYALTAPPVYQANLLLHVEEEQPNASRNILSDVASLFETKKAAIAEMELLRSRLVVARAVDTLRLYSHARPRYFPLGGAWVAERQGHRLPAPGLFGRGGYVWGGESIEVAAFELPERWYNHQFVLTALGDGRWRLTDNSGVTRLEGQVGVLARSSNGEVAGDAASARGEAAGSSAIALLVTRLRGQPGAQFLLRRSSRLAALERIQQSLQISEQGKLSGVIAVTLQGDDPQQVHATLTEIGHEYMRQNLARRTEEAQKTLTFLDRQLPLARQQLETAEAAYNSFRSSNETVDLGQEVRIALDTLAASQARRSALVQRRAELLGRYTDEHPLLEAVARQMRETQAEIAAMETRIRRLPRIEQEQARLAREVKVSTDLYTELLNSAQQLRLVAVGSIGTVRMVDMPVIPERTVKPNRPLIVLLGMVTGVFLGALLALGWRTVRGGIDDPERIEALLGPRTVCATIPHSRRQQRLLRRAGASGSLGAPGAAHALPVLSQVAPHDAAADSLRAFRAALQFLLPHCRNHVVACLGARQGAGAAFVSVNLALLLAAGGQRTLLIDGELDEGQLHACFALDRAAGLADCLAGVLPPQQAVRRAVAPLLDVVTAGGAQSAVSHGRELLQPRLLENFLAALASHYDVVLITAPPVLDTADALVVAALAGAVFVVARASVTTEVQLAAAVKRLNQAGVAPQGVVYNGA